MSGTGRGSLGSTGRWRKSLGDLGSSQLILWPFQARTSMARLRDPAPAEPQPRSSPPPKQDVRSGRLCRRARAYCADRDGGRGAAHKPGARRSRRSPGAATGRLSPSGTEDGGQAGGSISVRRPQDNLSCSASVPPVKAPAVACPAADAKSAGDPHARGCQKGTYLEFLATSLASSPQDNAPRRKRVEDLSILIVESARRCL